MNWQQRDAACVWHPFTPASAAPEIAVVKAEGVWLHTEDGRKILDGTSSWWVNAHGHAHPYIAERLAYQAQTLEHIIFAGFTHPPAIELAEQLLQFINGPQSRIFYSDNGSTAVEVALKMALQFFKNQEIPKKRIIALENAYHGDTFGAMSVGHRNAFSAAFSDLLFEVDFIPAPESGKEKESYSKFNELIKKGDVAAFIFEPLVQGAGGMRMYCPDTLYKMLVKCKFYGAFSIADEVFTGFYRTGTPLAVHQLPKMPDILCLSKTLTGGTLPLGVTAAPEFIFNAFQTSNPYHTFFHGHSFTANPLSCTAALASLELLKNETCIKNIQFIEQQHRAFADSIKKHSAIIEVRCLGTILAIELKTNRESGYLNPIAAQLTKFFLDRNIYLRPLGNVVYFTPPYIINEIELRTVHTAILACLDMHSDTY
jgi:adenosylmethionine-8-amino-7-oxononanoate aminotransferase